MGASDTDGAGRRSGNRRAARPGEGRLSGTQAGRRGRSARYLSEQDRQAQEEGLTPSWQSTNGVESRDFGDLDTTDGAELAQHGTEENDSRLREDKPPHW